MTIQGALADLNNLLKADDIPFYYKGSIEKVMETIEMEFEDKENDKREDLIKMEQPNKYKEKYKKLLKDYEKLENQCRSLFDRNSHLIQGIRELEDINDQLTEQLCEEGKI